MSLRNYLEKSSYQKTRRSKNRKFNDEQKINMVESILYSSFQRKKINNVRVDRMPKELMGVKLNWLSNDGTVELLSGPLKRVRNFNSQRKGPSGSLGEFAVKKSAFGSGVQPELRVKKGETKVLRSGIKHDYKKIYVEEGGRIVSDNKNNMLILLASEELIMENRSRIEWIGKNGASNGKPNTNPSLDGAPAPYPFEFYNGDYSSLENIEILNGEDGKGDNPGTAGESAGIIYIEAKKMRMAPTAAIRAIGGNGGNGPDGNGAGGNGGAIIVKTQIGINIETKKLAVTSGKSAGYDGFEGMKDVEFLQ